MTTLTSTSSPIEEKSISEDNIHVSLTHSPLDLNSTLNLVRSPSAGALVLFAGTTRDSFASRPVVTLSYTSYVPLALQTMLSIGRAVKGKHGLIGLAITHRLGVVGVGEESIHIAVSAAHRGEAWRAGEECLEEVKAKVEVWKEERFEDGAVWRANRDGEWGVEVEDGEEKMRRC